MGNKITVYKNMTVAKLKNRRVMARAIVKNNDVRISFVTLTDDLNPRAHHEVAKDKIVATTLFLSKEAALGLYECLGHELLKMYEPVIEIENERK